MSEQFLMTLGSERYLNKVNYQYILSTDVAQQYPGLLGKKWTIDQATAENLTDSSVAGYSSSTKLGPGTYQLVKFASGLSITPARGLAVYWKAGEEPGSFVVTTDQPTGGTQFAGICINAVTAGYYGFILVSPGIGHVKGAAALSQTGAVGQPLFVDAATGTFDNPAPGIFTLAIPITLAQITGAGDILTNFTPGFAGKILSVTAAVTKVVTTAAKAASLNMEIGTTNLTGGVVALTSANCTPLGALVAGTSITANNTFTATDTISIEAASVTAFAEGEIVLLITVQNLTQASATPANVIAYEAPAAGSLKKAFIARTMPNPAVGHF